jgi:hypothetical protein
MQAILLLAFMAITALSTGVNHTTYSNPVTNGILCNSGTDLADNPGNLMAWNERILDWTPLPAGGMNVRVADPGEFNLNQNILRLKLPALNGR